MYNRPAGYEHEKLDCTVRAFSLAANITYEQAHEAFKSCGRRDGHKFHDDPHIRKICRMFGLEAKLVKRSGSLKRLLRNFPTGNLYCSKVGHAFAVINGTQHDVSGNPIIKRAWLLTKII